MAARFWRGFCWVEIVAWLKPGVLGSPWIAFAGIALIAQFLIALRRGIAVKRIVLGALKSYEGEKASLARLTAETGVSEKDLKRTLADLRGALATGWTKGLKSCWFFKV